MRLVVRALDWEMGGGARPSQVRAKWWGADEREAVDMELVANAGDGDEAVAAEFPMTTALKFVTTQDA